MKRVQQGFTLIELMIVVAIIGILAAIAIPAYQDYTKRAHVSEGLSLAAGAKTAVSEYYSTNNAWPTNNASAGLASSTAISGNAVGSVAVNASQITVTFNSKIDTAASRTLVLAASASGGSIIWSCTGGDVDTKFRPSNCRR